jgi:hypothetical protein
MNENKPQETPYKVDRPVYVDYTVLVPKFVDKKIAGGNDFVFSIKITACYIDFSRYK